MHRNEAELVVRKCGPLSAISILDLEASAALVGRFHRNEVYDRVGSNPMVGNDWLLSYKAERLFGYRLKRKNRQDYSVFGDFINDNVQFYDRDAIPYVFQFADDDDDVDEALEDRLNLYEDEDDEDGDDPDFDGPPDWI